MLTKTEIANLALGRLGVSKMIVSLDDDTSTPGKVIRQHFKNSVKQVLRKHKWGFATAQAPLALTIEPPNNTWSYEYQYPEDALVIRNLGVEGVFPKTELYEDEKQLWEDVYSSTGQRLQTDIGEAWAKYTRDMSDNTSFPDHFGNALAAHLALMIAPSIITNNFSKVRQVLMSEAKNEISIGIADDIAQQPQKPASDSPYVRARM